MSDINAFNDEMKKYYNSLPKYLKDGIVRTPQTLSTLGELQSATQNIERRQSTQF